MAQWLCSHVLLRGRGFASSDPLGVDLCTAYQAMLWQAYHIESRGRWARMLAQGHSSSKKKKPKYVHVFTTENTQIDR